MQRRDSTSWKHDKVWCPLFSKQKLVFINRERALEPSAKCSWIDHKRVRKCRSTLGFENVLGNDFTIVESSIYTTETLTVPEVLRISTVAGATATETILSKLEGKWSGTSVDLTLNLVLVEPATSASSGAGRSTFSTSVTRTRTKPVGGHPTTSGSSESTYNKREDQLPLEIAIPIIVVTFLFLMLGISWVKHRRQNGSLMVNYNAPPFKKIEEEASTPVTSFPAWKGKEEILDQAAELPAPVPELPEAKPELPEKRAESLRGGAELSEEKSELPKEKAELPEQTADSPDQTAHLPKQTAHLPEEKT